MANIGVLKTPTHGAGKLTQFISRKIQNRDNFLANCLLNKATHVSILHCLPHGIQPTQPGDWHQRRMCAI